MEERLLDLGADLPGPLQSDQVEEPWGEAAEEATEPDGPSGSDRPSGPARLADDDPPDLIRCLDLDAETVRVDWRATRSPEELAPHGPGTDRDHADAVVPLLDAQ